MTDKKQPNADIIRKARALGYNAINYVGRARGADVFSLGCVDETGFPLPIGLPRLLLQKGKDISDVFGEEAFDMLKLFYDE